MKQKNLNSFEVEQLKQEVLKLKSETILKCNKVLQFLEYQPEELFLGTDIEYIYPYLVVANLKLEYKVAEKFLLSYNSHGFRHFIDTYIEPIKMRFGNLVCPMYSDGTNGLHNPIAFNEDCLNDLLNYILNNDREDFFNFVSNFFTEILDSTELKRRYGLSSKAETLDINQNENIKRETIIKYLKNKGLLK